MPTIVTETFQSAAGASLAYDTYDTVGDGTGISPSSFATLLGETSDTDSSGLAFAISHTTMTVSLKADSTSNNYAWFDRAFPSFDTSSLPDDAVATSAKLYLTPTFKDTTLGSTNIHLTSFSPASFSTNAASDFVNVGSTSFGYVSTGDLTVNTESYIEFNQAGLDSIITTAPTGFALRTEWDLNGVFTGTWSSTNSTSVLFATVDHATSAYRPRFEVSYYVPRDPETFPHSKIYDYEGTEFQPSKTKIWNGSAWVYSQPKMYDGTEWRNLA